MIQAESLQKTLPPSADCWINCGKTTRIDLNQKHSRVISFIYRALYDKLQNFYCAA